MENKCMRCKQPMTDTRLPMRLDCHHELCLDCIAEEQMNPSSQYAIDGKTMKVKCPQCSKVTVLEALNKLIV